MEDPQTEFLFDIIKEIKHYYETPVVYVTKKDYADLLFNAMCALRAALQSKENDKIIDIIADYHLQWLHAVNEIENFKKVINDVTRTDISESVSYTIDALTTRLKYFQRYMKSNRAALSNTEQAYLSAESEIVEDMHKDTTLLLLQKLKCFRSFVGDQEFRVKLYSTTDELLNWFDKMCDSLSVQVSKYVNVNLPQLKSDLTKTLRQIVDELSASNSPSAVRMIDNLKEKEELCSMIRTTSKHDLEVSKVIEKINILDDRIKRLESEPMSAAVMAITHKKEYLEKRLNSLENLKTTIKSLHNLENVTLEDLPDGELCSCSDFFTFKIFNHLLPLVEREKLITELCYLWDFAIFGDKKSRKSMISILSATEMKEEFNDDMGTFYIDEHSRKIYKIPDDDVLYQPNELNELVPLADDDDHIYFYDECGRYFIDPNTRQRIYKAYGTASEYMMGSSGALLKVKEQQDGVTFYYDNYGRYFINEDGKHIYRDPDSVSEYENDGLGNLVRIHSRLDMFELCSGDANVSEDFNYLKKTVGAAIRVSIADCIIHQPVDPIKYLSMRLKKYRDNLKIKERRAADFEELNVQREIILAEERAAAEGAAMEAALLTQGGSEASYDSNLVNYSHLNADDTVSVVSTK